MKNLYLLITLCFITTSSFGCCAESSYRIFPLGEINNDLVFVEFSLSKRCKVAQMPGRGDDNEIWVSGIVNLVALKNDSITIIENIDTINILDCICTYKNHYTKSKFENVMGNLYMKAYDKVKQSSKYLAQPKSIVFNDTINTKIIETDSSYRLYYKELLNLDLDSVPVISCNADQVIEVRTYETKHYKITIIRLACYSIKQDAIPYNTIRFKSIETAFWKEQAIWHGTLKDYVFVDKK
jgi:hypothetical protein